MTGHPEKLLLLNPNTNAEATAAMVAVAMAAAQGKVHIEGRTAAVGARLICDEPQLEIAATAVADLVAMSDLSAVRGLIVAGFGDPGIEQIRTTTSMPVTGIAEAAIMEAAEGGRDFSIVTTQPLLLGAIERRVTSYGYRRQLTGIRLTQGAVSGVALADQADARTALLDACIAAIDSDGAKAIVIGGGPLAAIARTLARSLSVPLIEPIPAAVRLAMARAKITGK